MPEGRKQILFVDDDPMVLEALRDRLRRYRNKWDMFFVTSGEEALAETEKRQIDVVVSDMRMPKMDGAELLQHLQKNRPEIVRIILSGYAELEAAMRAVPVAHQFLAKPVEPQKLEEVIERACSLQVFLKNETIRSLAGRLNTLPSVPRLYAELTRILADENTGVEKVADVVEKDLAMCAKILQIVNSSFFGFPRRITIIRNAISYLGLNMIRNLSLSAGVFASGTKPAPAGLSLETLQLHSMFVATLAMNLMQKDLPLKAQDAFLAGLLHDLGQLILAVGLEDEYAQVLQRSKEVSSPIHEVERQMLHATHAEVGAYVLGIWGLPYPIVEAVAYSHSPDAASLQELDLVAVVFISNCLHHQAVCKGMEKANRYTNDLDNFVSIRNWQSLHETWKGMASALNIDIALQDPRS